MQSVRTPHGDERETKTAAPFDFHASYTRSESRWFVFGLIVSLAVLGIYYGRGWWRGDPTDFLIMYRPGIGDRDYYPLALQFAEGRFGEAFTAGRIGEGWIGFPCASVLPHGLALRFFGPAGFALMDIVTPPIFFVVSVRTLIAAGVTRHTAIAGALCLTMQGFTAAAHALVAVFGYALHGLPFYLEFLQSWGLRYPRNFVSEIYGVGALGCWCELARAGLQNRRTWWIATAVWMAGVLQSDIYSFVALAIAFCVMGAIRLRADRATIGPALWRRLALAIGIFILCALPFLVQRWHASPDILERYGVFRLARQDASELATRAWHFFPPVFIRTTLVLPWLLWVVARGLGRTSFFPASLALAFTVLQLAGYAAMPVFVAVSGQAVQLYHFRDAAHSLVAWTGLLSLATAATALANVIPPPQGHSFRWLAPLGTYAAAVGFLALLVPLDHTAQRHLNNPGTPRMIGVAVHPLAHSYRADWVALAHELDRPAYASTRVIATLDGEIFSWWLTFRRGKSYLGHIFLSALPERELWTRLMEFARLNQIEADKFMPWLLAYEFNEVHCLWFSGNRYQANPLHTFSTLDDYSSAERQRINATDLLDCWYLVIPQGEQRRLIRDYEVYQRQPAVHWPPPELIVLTREFPQMQPDPRLYVLAYENPTFQLFRAVIAAPSPPSRAADLSGFPTPPVAAASARPHAR